MGSYEKIVSLNACFQSVMKASYVMHLRYSSKFALTHTCTCMYIVTLHFLNFLSFLTCIDFITSAIFPKRVLFFLLFLYPRGFFHSKCINPIVVSSFSLVTTFH